jgi:hypothetical protein
MSNAGCSMRRLAVLATATSWLTGCATVASEPRIVTVCPPVIEYSREVQAQAARELGMLPDGTTIAGMLADYSVMRDQARACPHP